MAKIFKISLNPSKILIPIDNKGDKIGKRNTKKVKGNKMIVTKGTIMILFRIVRRFIS